MIHHSWFLFFLFMVLVRGSYSSCSWFLSVVRGSWSVIIVLIILAQNTKDVVHILRHSLPILCESRSTTSLKHSEPLHILIGQSITTKPGFCTPWNHIFREALESILSQTTQEMSTFGINPCQYSWNIRVLLLYNILSPSIH
jgi:hypothetical protein